jgi:regulator of ribosome biosynthesis
MPSEHSLESELLSLSRDNAQLLVNEIFSLPTLTNEDGIFAKLPESKLALPRAKPIPQPKPKTKWKKFAESKNITREKRSSMVYDENRKNYIPRYGSKSAKNDPMANWVEEL